jgi:hypothetical protein
VRDYRKEAFDYHKTRYCPPLYAESAHHLRADFTRTAKAYQHGSSFHKNGLSNHQVHQPLTLPFSNIRLGEEKFVQIKSGGMQEYVLHTNLKEHRNLTLDVPSITEHRNK